jgi:hypothetical protein
MREMSNLAFPTFLCMIASSAGEGIRWFPSMFFKLDVSIFFSSGEVPLGKPQVSHIVYPDATLNL